MIDILWKSYNEGLEDALKAGIPLTLNHDQPDDFFAEALTPLFNDVRYSVWLPVATNEKYLGAISLLYKGPISPELTSTLSILANQFASTLFNLELTSEKMSMGHFCDGRASLVVGTHTHVPTADTQVLPGGTGYQTDAGMTGDYDSVIGMDKAEPLNRFTRRIPSGRFEPAMGEATLCGVLVETDDRTGLAVRTGAVRVGGRLQEALPDWASS